MAKEAVTWVAYCLEEKREIERAPNGEWVEAAGRVHARNTGHKVIVGFVLEPGKHWVQEPIRRRGKAEPIYPHVPKRTVRD